MHQRQIDIPALSGAVDVEDPGDDPEAPEGRELGDAVAGAEGVSGGNEGGAADVLVHAEEAPLEAGLVRELAFGGVLAVGDAVAAVLQTQPQLGQSRSRWKAVWITTGRCCWFLPVFNSKRF